MNDHNNNRPVTGYPAGAAAAPPPNPGTYSAGAGAYPYAAPPPPAPYYGANYAYYNPNPNAVARANFLRRVVAIFAGSLIVTGVVIVIIWLIVRPRVPEFRVDSLAISNLNLSNSLITANWDLRFTARNPNKKIVLYYDEVTAAIFYDTVSISDTTVPPFYQGKLDETAQKASFASSGAYVKSWAFDGMNKERAQSGRIGFNVRMVVKLRLKAGAWWARRRYLKVYCGVLAVGVSNNSSGSLIGGPRQCRVGL